MNSAASPGSARRKRILWAIRRIGVAGFLFFLLKGLAWLVVPALLWRQIAG